MKTILFHQNVSYKVNDIFVIDGVATESNGSSQQQEALDILHNTSNKIKKFWFPAEIKKNCSNVLELYFGLNDIYIVSQSKTLDEGGRPISFEFYSATYTDPEATTNQLRDSIEKAGLQANESEIQAIEWAVKLIPFEKKFAAAILVFVVLLILIFTISK